MSTCWSTRSSATSPTPSQTRAWRSSGENRLPSGNMPGRSLEHAPEAVRARVRFRSYVDEATLARSATAAPPCLPFSPNTKDFGLTPLEAMAHGVPPVVLDTEVAREVYGPAARYLGRARLWKQTSDARWCALDRRGERRGWWRKRQRCCRATIGRGRRPNARRPRGSRWCTLALETCHRHRDAQFARGDRLVPELGRWAQRSLAPRGRRSWTTHPAMARSLWCGGDCPAVQRGRGGEQRRLRTCQQPRRGGHDSRIAAAAEPRHRRAAGRDSAADRRTDPSSRGRHRRPAPDRWEGRPELSFGPPISPWGELRAEVTSGVVHPEGGGAVRRVDVDPLGGRTRLGERSVPPDSPRRLGGGRRLRRAVLHVHRGRGPVCLGSRPRAGGRFRSRGRGAASPRTIGWRGTPRPRRLRRLSHVAFYEKHLPHWAGWLRLYLRLTGRGAHG